MFTKRLAKEIIDNVDELDIITFNMYNLSHSEVRFCAFNGCSKDLYDSYEEWLTAMERIINERYGTFSVVHYEMKRNRIEIYIRVNKKTFNKKKEGHDE